VANVTPPVAVRPESFKTSSKAFADINKAIGAAALTLVNELATMNNMAGTDGKAKTFADKYDEITNGTSGVCAGIKLMADATDKMAELLDASAVNHTNANNAYAPCSPGVPTGLGYTNGELTKPRIASAFGGPGEPSNWEMIKSYVEGEIFPDGDPEKLDKAAEAWRKMGTVLREQPQRVDAAIAHIANEKSAEVDPAQTQAGLIKKHLADIAGAHDKVAKLLTDFATHVRDVRDETKTALTELAWELVGGFVLGAALTLVTAGASNLAATAVGLLRLTQTGAKIAGFIRRFGTAIDKVMQAASYIENPAGAAAGDLGGLLGSRGTTFGKALGRKKKSSDPKRQSELDKATAGMSERVKRQVELATDPDALEQQLIADGIPPDLAREAAQNSPYANMSPQEVVDKYTRDGRFVYPDNDGFAGGKYTTSDRIPESATLDRVGPIEGSFMGSPADSYGQRALAPGSTGDYTTLVGTGKELPAGWEVRSGEIAKAFDQPGGGTQYVVMKPGLDGKMERVSVEELLDLGYVRQS
jgi:hypothetical protein